MSDYLALYLVGAIAWPVVGLLVTGAAALSDGLSNTESAAPRIARWTLAAPVWPPLLIVLVAVGVFRFVRFAFGRDR